MKKGPFTKPYILTHHFKVGDRVKNSTNEGIIVEAWWFSPQPTLKKFWRYKVKWDGNDKTETFEEGTISIKSISSSEAK